MALIDEALVAIGREVDAIDKAQENVQQGWKFRGIDDVMNALHPLFAKHGVVIVQRDADCHTEKYERNGRVIFFTILTTEWDLIASDGSKRTIRTIAQGLDTSDKGALKAASGAFKYALLRMSLIPTADQVDPDRETLEVAAEAAAPAMITAAQQQEIEAEMERLEVDRERFCAYFGVSSVGELREEDAVKARGLLDRKSRATANDSTMY